MDRHVFEISAEHHEIVAQMAAATGLTEINTLQLLVSLGSSVLRAHFKGWEITQYTQDGVANIIRHYKRHQRAV